MSTAISAIAQLAGTLDRVPLIAQVLTKGTLLLLVAVCLTRLLVRAPAAARHLVWSLSMTGLLLLPAARLVPWRLELSALASARDALGVVPPERVSSDAAGGAAKSRREPRPAIDARVATSAIDADQAPKTLETAGLPVRGPSFVERWSDPGSLLVVAWLAGMVWMFGRLVIGIASVHRIVRRAVPADDTAWQSLVASAQAALGTRPRARVVISREAAMPFTSGLVRPVIVLPSSADAWTTDRRRSVLLHEMAHLRRRDLLTNALVQIASAIYWFHPLVRLAARRVRIEAERACDALVVAAGTRPSDYAGDLLDIARTMRSSATATVALAMARRSDFEGRLLAILAPDSGRTALTAARTALLVASFAAPAMAIAAAVPAKAAAPNVFLAEPTAKRTDANTAESSRAEPAATSQAARVVPLVQDTGGQAQAPAQQGRDAAIPALLSVLADSSADVRLAAVESLGNLADPRAVDALVQALRTDTDARVREAAAESLGQIDSPRAVPGLIAALGSERIAAVRAKIAWALGEIDDARAVDALSAAVRDTAAEVRRQVVWALGELGAASAAPALISTIRDPDVETRKQAVWALGEIKSADAISPLSVATRDANAEVRKQAIEALGQIADKRALAALEAATRDADVEVRRAAVEAIGQLDELKSAPDALLAATRDADADVRKAAAEALGQIEDEGGVPALIPLTRDANTEVKRAAVEALASIGGPRSIEVMAALLKDEDPAIRKLAAEALGKNR